MRNQVRLVHNGRVRPARFRAVFDGERMPWNRLSSQGGSAEVVALTPPQFNRPWLARFGGGGPPLLKNGRCADRKNLCGHVHKRLKRNMTGTGSSQRGRRPQPQPEAYSASETRGYCTSNRACRPDIRTGFELLPVKNEPFDERRVERSERQIRQDYRAVSSNPQVIKALSGSAGRQLGLPRNGWVRKKTCPAAGAERLHDVDCFPGQSRGSPQWQVRHGGISSTARRVSVSGR
jgi:hypothetical protein